ncbi:hypothetical protein MC885_016346 [Smutsia gigantea]|nr:hypothetical protein MC885_016346 [Smutsia gigantea]
MGLFPFSSRGYPAYQVGAHTHEVPPCTSVLAGRYPCRNPSEGRGRPNQGPRSSGRNGSAREQGGQLGRGVATPGVRAPDVRAAPTQGTSGPAGGGASGSGPLAGARAPSCCGPGTGTEARLVPVSLRLSSSRLAQPGRPCLRLQRKAPAPRKGLRRLGCSIWRRRGVAAL